MKKKMIALVAGALMAMSASSAFASFADLELIRVVYQRSGGTVEVATDLGKISDILATTGSTTYGSGINSFASLTAGASNLYAAYFAVDRTTNQLWLSGGASTPSEGTAKSGTVNSVSNAMYLNYNALAPVAAGATTVLGSTSNGNSYKVKAGVNGAFGTVITTNPSVDANLATLATASISQNLWYKANYVTNGALTKVMAQDGTSALQILTNADGSTTINNPAGAAQTPIPAAAYLLGSGLLGLLGLRRKQNVA